MSKLSKTPPLKIVHVDYISQVPTYSNDPLLFRKKGASKKIRQELALLKQLAHMELVLEKIHRLDIWKSKLQVSNETLRDLHQTVLQIQVDIQNNRGILNSLAKTHVKQIYPRASQLLLDDADDIHTSSNNNHASSIQHLDQLFVTASRLYHDLNNLKNHKYIAYQLALLYQCVNRQGVSFVNYKVRIEQRFDEIKSATKKEPVYLDPDQKSWLRLLALDIITQATGKSSIVKCGGHLFSVVQEISSM
ncbi:unnamed protein product [Mucor circinelloides]|uniref:Uncharacterized protein n=1 Tax=Mucor circinelloides f. circinelloides (strain 1006PhL) TaxID=1220926 RepID=S2K849_MUCC1|nr:hypothetical protein HMPREF1544_04761 [Mucor circinelloides 1006PhL]